MPGRPYSKGVSHQRSVLCQSPVTLWPCMKGFGVRGLRCHLFRDWDRVQDCCLVQAQDRGETEAIISFLIPGSFRGKIEEFLGHFTFFETNIKDETRLWLSPRSRRDRGEEFLLIPRSFRGWCEDLADLCLEYVRNIPLYRYINAYIIAKGLSAFKTCEPPKVRIVQSHFNRTARAITSWL